MFPNSDGVPISFKIPNGIVTGSRSAYGSEQDRLGPKLRSETAPAELK
jgi:hypothetical protein